MSKPRTIEISALNIAMHSPHRRQAYVALFWAARRLKKLVELGSLHAAILGILEGPKEYTPGSYLTGEIYRFVRLDASMPWYNMETSEVASDDDLSAVSIPPHLLPNLQRIEFVFRPDNHQLWFIAKDRKDRMGPRAMADFFGALFDVLTREKGFPTVEVTVLPDQETVEELLSLHKIERLTIELKRPNSDDGSDEERRLLERLEKQGARTMKTEFVSADEGGVKPDEETMALARVSAKNGVVSVVGRDATGRKIQESTIKKPMVLSEKVDPELEIAQDVLRRVAL